MILGHSAGRVVSLGEAVAGEIRRSGVRALAHKADVSDEAQVQEMFRRAIADLGTIDILVTNAGLAGATLGALPRGRAASQPLP